MQAATVTVTLEADMRAITAAFRALGVSMETANAAMLSVFDLFDAYLMLDDPPDARVGPPTPSDGWVPSRMALSVTVSPLHRPARARGPPLAVRMT